MAKILFLEVCTESSWALASVGPAYIASYIRQQGHQAFFLSIPSEQALKESINQIKQYSIDLIGISITSRQWRKALALASEIKQALDTPIIAGGLHASFCSDEILASNAFDFACIGEGEQATLELLNAIANNEPTNVIANIRVPGGAPPHLSPPIAKLDELPFMARDMLGEQYGVIHLSTQRGCPFPCTYCAAQQVSQLYAGGYKAYGRRRSVENILDELHEIKQHQAINYVVFLDDTFTLHHDWLDDFLPRYKREFHIPFSINARAETINQTLLHKLADAGCMHIIYGVESGSEKLRKEVLQRNVSNQRLCEVFQWTREANIMVTANYMLGLPEETPEDIELTLSLHEQLRPDDFGYFIYYPFPGTHLFQLCKDRDYLPENYLDLPANHRESILHLPTLSKSELKGYYQRFTDVQIKDRQKKSETFTAAQQNDIKQQVTQAAAKA